MSTALCFDEMSTFDLVVGSSRETGRSRHAVAKVVADANRYFASEEPWTKRKTDFSRMATVLGVTAEVLRVVAIMAQPAMPGAMDKLLDILAQPADARDFAHADAAHRLGEGTALPAPAPIFPRYVEQDEKKS